MADGERRRVVVIAPCSAVALVASAGCVGSTPTPPVTPTPTATPPPSATALPPPPSGVSSAHLYPTGLGVAVVGAGNGGRLFKTLDAGRTWINITPPVAREPAERGADPLDIYRAHFIDARRGWVIRTSDVGGGFGMLLLQRTMDGGRTWVTGRNVDTVSLCHHAGAEVSAGFVDSRRGWLVGICLPGEQRRLARTRDGGITWEALDDLPVYGHVRFRDGERGWLGESVFLGVDQLYETVDGGVTWRGHPIATPRGYAKGKVSVGLPTLFGARGILPVVLDDEPQRVAFYRTNDGARTWSFRVMTPRTPAARGAPDADTFNRAEVSVLDMNTWWVLPASDPATIATTDDAGTTWSAHPAPVGAHSLTARDAGTAWVVGDQGLFVTRNGGKTWVPTHPARTRS